MICEKCKKEHDGSYGSGRFCSSKCARSFSTLGKRQEINKKVSQTLKGYRTVQGGKIKLCDYGCGQIANYQMENGKWCCEDSYNKCPFIRNKNSKALKKSYRTNNRRFIYSHLMNWRKNSDSYGYKKWVEFAINKIFIENPINFADHKLLLIEMFDWKYECSMCGLTEWNNNSISLHIDHIDGNNRNFKFENLRFLCPNCHSQTETYCGKNINSGKPKIKDKELIKYLNNSSNIHQALLKARMTPKGKNYDRAYKLIHEHNIKFGEIDEWHSQGT